MAAASAAADSFFIRILLSGMYKSVIRTACQAIKREIDGGAHEKGHGAQRGEQHPFRDAENHQNVADDIVGEDHVQCGGRKGKKEDQQNLAADGARKQGQLPRLFERIDRLLRETPVQQAVKRACLAGFQPLQISFDPGDG